MDASDLRWAHVKARFGHPDFVASPRPGSRSGSEKNFSEKKKKEEEVSSLVDDAMGEEKEHKEADVVMERTVLMRRPYRLRFYLHERVQVVCVISC